MNAYARGKAGNLTIIVPARNASGYVLRSIGSASTTLKTQMRRMCRELKADREWWLLDAVRDDRCSLPRAYDHWSARTLDHLRAELSESNLTDHLDGWEQWVKSNLGETGTAEMYRRQVSSLIRARFLASDLTPARVSEWLAAYRSPPGPSGRLVSTGYKRKLLYAVFSFVSYLRELEILDRNPLDNIKRPKKGKARIRWETVENDLRIVDAAPPQYRALFAFIHATGAEVSAALVMLRRDIDLGEGTAHVPGSKTAKRNRHDVLIEPWALMYLASYCAGLLPNASLWPGISRYQAHWHHTSAAKAIGVSDYTLRDSRHSWAVRARKRGVSFEDISAQLGSSVATVVTVYAAFKPTIRERQEAAK